MNKTIHEKSETKPTAKGQRGKRYEEAFKRQAVVRWRQGDKPGTQVARELGVSDPTLKPLGRHRACAAGLEG